MVSDHDDNWPAGVRLTRVEWSDFESDHLHERLMGPLARVVARRDGVLHVEDPDGYALLLAQGDWRFATVRPGTDEYADESEAAHAPYVIDRYGSAWIQLGHRGWVLRDGDTDDPQSWQYLRDRRGPIRAPHPRGEA